MPRIALAVSSLLLLLAPSRSEAAFHLAVIDEVMSGFGGDSTAQYVEIRTLAGSQTFVKHTRLTAFNCDGSTSTVLINDLPSNICNGAAGVRWTMGTASWATATGVTPDFTFPNGIFTPCGQICWGAPSGAFVPPADPNSWSPSDPDNYVDCVAYGGYSGTRQITDAAATTLPPGNGTNMSLQRNADTGSDMADFALATATPTNNGPCPTTTTTTIQGGTTTTTTFPPGTGERITGTKLLLKANPNKPGKKALVLLAKDGSITLGEGNGSDDDPTRVGGTLFVAGSAGGGVTSTYPLAASKWHYIGTKNANKGYRFKDAAGAIKLLILKKGKLIKANGHGAQLTHSLATNPDPVSAVLVTGTGRYCMTFAGGTFVAGKKYLATGSQPPGTCP